MKSYPRSQPKGYVVFIGRDLYASSVCQGSSFQIKFTNISMVDLSYYPSSNKVYYYFTSTGDGQVKKINKVIIKGIKKKLDDTKGLCAE